MLGPIAEARAHAAGRGVNLRSIAGEVTAFARAADNAQPAQIQAAQSSTPQTLTITATDPDGVNTGTARLGVPVYFTSVVTGNHKIVAWSLTGAGSLTYGGTNNNHATYTPPLVMPGNVGATITAYMDTMQSVKASYSLNLINPIPSVSTVSPTQLLTGGTQSLSLVGSGFVAGTSVTLNGTALPVTVTDYQHAAVLVPVAANATGSLNLQLANPAPGGGAGPTLAEPIAADSVTLTATSQDGTNTGFAELGINVNVAATVTGAVQTNVKWTLAGAGTLSTGGVYTAPAALPTNNAVTITATLVSNPAITAAYQLNIINPVPVINSATPAVVPSGATTAVTLTGSGFVPGTVIVPSVGTVVMTYSSATSVTALITVPANATGNLSLSGVNASPGGGAGDQFEEAISAPVGVTAAARILDQTTFGPTTNLIQHVETEGVTAWLAEQFNTPTTVMPLIPPVFPSYCGDAANCAESEWWQTVLTGNDQLRQRVAFTLSELFVVSTHSMEGNAIIPYANMLANDAFGNWYTIMNDVTLSPAMAMYLNMLNSYKSTGNVIANENFARENMQLFNLGLYLLNQDGSRQLDGNQNPIPTYSEATVEQFARIYTGWTFANPTGAPQNNMTGTPYYYSPLVPVEHWHDQTAKVLLNGEQVPAGQTAEQDLAAGLTNIFNHPNLPPFVSKQLIQHLVTSTPSPGYISRVAAVFTDNGNGVRGDMKAVLTAIFTDPEARAGDTNNTSNDGHLREPILWLTAVMRGLGFVSTDPNNYYRRLSDYSGALSEIPYSAASVFNFYSPSYMIPGTTLNAPEFAIENTASVTDRLSLADTLVNNDLVSFNVDLSPTSPLGKLASNSANLVDALGVLFMHGAMDSHLRSVIIAATAAVTDPGQRVRIATYLVITSGQYKNLH